MATPLSAAAMLAALRAEGVKVQEHRAWRTHNRNHKGPWGPVHGVYIHHTAGVGSGLADYCYNGNADLPGPVCHAFASKAATVYMIGSGRANHAGGIAANAYKAVVDESSVHPRPDVAEPIDGNAHFYGLEIENRGDGRDPYPTAQYDQSVRWAAAICRAHKWGPDSVIGHKEATRRKIDPSFSMTQFRADVAERLTHPASWSPGSAPPPQEEDDMTPEQAAQLKRIDERLNVAPWTYKGTAQPTRDAYNFLVTADQNAKRALDGVTALAAKVDALEATPLTDAQIAAIAAAVASSPVLADAIADKLAARLAD